MLKRDLGSQRSETEFVLLKLRVAERQVGNLLNTTLSLVDHVLKKSVEQVRVFFCFFLQHEKSQCVCV
jgi:hypothetical protein